MHSPRLTAALAFVALVSASSLSGQEPHRLGLNLSVAGSSQVGLTYQATSRVALRPAVTFAWRKYASTVGPGATAAFLDYGGSVDVLVMVSRGLAVRPYVGAGGSYVVNHGESGDGHTAGASGLVGVRARVLERIHVYGELALRYQTTSPTGTLGGIGTSYLVASTTPLGVLIYFH